ncbi:MAG TPA: adenylate/guanylate cyclase domain-containing protein [Candidatus Acidoferrales bacterium]|nr:adenylate/guanylate cyclase domain-containing protein [Candidatus Acidoferrales bacterium]
MPPDTRIRVVLADDNLIVREGVRALLSIAGDLEVVGVAGDYDELLAGAAEHVPQVVVTDIRMPPDFTDEGIRAARIVRMRNPGTGVVILSQYDEPEYAIALLSEGAAGYAYLLKDRVGDGDQLARAVREVSTGGSMLDPRIVDALTRPVSEGGGLTDVEERLLRMVAEGKPIKAIAATLHTTPTSVGDDVEQLFLKLAQQASAGTQGALDRLRLLHKAIVDREEQGESLSRMLPGGVAEQMRERGVEPGRTERLTVTVLMSDIRAYSTIAEASDPSVLAGQLNEHRAAMNRAVLAEGGTVMQFVGDAVMAVFGAPLPQPDHAQRSLAAALAMHAAQERVNEQWAAIGLPPFHIGIGLSTGDVAAALLGSQERLEYSIVGDAVNLAQRLQQWGEGGQTVLSEPTYDALLERPEAERIEPALVKGRHTPVGAYRIGTVAA